MNINAWIISENHHILCTCICFPELIWVSCPRSCWVSCSKKHYIELHVHTNWKAAVHHRTWATSIWIPVSNTSNCLIFDTLTGSGTVQNRENPCLNMPRRPANPQIENIYRFCASYCVYIPTVDSIRTFVRSVDLPGAIITVIIPSSFWKGLGRKLIFHEQKYFTKSSHSLFKASLWIK